MVLVFTLARLSVSVSVSPESAWIRQSARGSAVPLTNYLGIPCIHVRIHQAQRLQSTRQSRNDAEDRRNTHSRSGGGLVRKNVWREGMFLTPQHFQQWDHYYDSLLNSRLQTWGLFGWGLLDLALDVDHLANGTVALTSLRAVLPDGTMLRLGPDGDPLPESRPLEKAFPASANHLDVFIGAPVQRPGVANCRPDGAGTGVMTRCMAEAIKVADHNTGEGHREIEVARTKTKLFCGGEDTTAWVTLKLAEVVRTSLAPSPCGKPAFLHA